MEVRSLAWSPDGRRLASGGLDRTFKVWDVEARQEVATRRANDAIVQCLSWGPDGRLAVASTSTVLQLFDGATLEEVAVLRGHRSGLQAVCWSPDGRRLASTGRDQTIRVWDAQTGRELAVLSGHMAWVNALSWSPDGRRLASAGSDRTVRLWDVETGREVLALRGHAHDVITAVGWAPDGLRLASAGHDGTVRLWDVTPGYVADRSPALLPVLEQRLKAGPARAADLRLRAEVYARQGRWDLAAADWEASARQKGPAAPWFVAGWWARGPFAAGAAPEEAGMGPGPTHPPPAGSAASLHWRWVTASTNGCLDFQEAQPGNRAERMQVLVRVYSPRQQAVTARFGSTVPFRAWLNGRPAHARETVRLAPTPDNTPPGEPPDDEVALTLAAGWNTLLFRVTTGRGQDRLCLSLVPPVRP
jgi:WD40 repeat protein